MSVIKDAVEFFHFIVYFNINFVYAVIAPFNCLKECAVCPKALRTGIPLTYSTVASVISAVFFCNFDMSSEFEEPITII